MDVQAQDPDVIFVAYDGDNVRSNRHFLHVPCIYDFAAPPRMEGLKETCRWLLMPHERKFRGLGSGVSDEVWMNNSCYFGCMRTCCVWCLVSVVLSNISHGERKKWYILRVTATSSRLFFQCFDVQAGAPASKKIVWITSLQLWVQAIEQRNETPDIPCLGIIKVREFTYSPRDYKFIKLYEKREKYRDRFDVRFGLLLIRLSVPTSHPIY